MDTNLHDQSDPFAFKEQVFIEKRVDQASSLSESDLSTKKDHLYIDTQCKCPLHDQRIKFYNRPRSQPNKCICTSQRFYNCNYCTSNYPISVRRSKDGEETDYSTKLKQTLYDKTESNGGCQSVRIDLRPSPLPVSPHLIALLTLTSPSNKFIPAPNKNLATVVQNKDREPELLVCE